MIDATHLKTHRTASSQGLKKAADDKRDRLIGRSSRFAKQSGGLFP